VGWILLAYDSEKEWALEYAVMNTRSGYKCQRTLLNVQLNGEFKRSPWCFALCKRSMSKYLQLYDHI